MSNKKQLLTRTSVKHPNLLEIYYENGGERPKELSGLYTSEEDARSAISSYTARTSKKTTAVEV